MTPKQTEVRASLLMADYVNVETGKAMIIGGGIRVIPLDPASGTTGPFAIFAMLEAAVPSGGDAPAVEILLADANGQVVSLAGPEGQPQPVRISQNVDFQHPMSPGVVIPKGAIPSTAQMAVNFPNGLPLAQNVSYQWRVQVDHEIAASYSFYVPRPQPGPIFG